MKFNYKTSLYFLLFTVSLMCVDSIASTRSPLSPSEGTEGPLSPRAPIHHTIEDPISGDEADNEGAGSSTEDELNMGNSKEKTKSRPDSPRPSDDLGNKTSSKRKSPRLRRAQELVSQGFKGLRKKIEEKTSRHNSLGELLESDEDFGTGGSSSGNQTPSSDFSEAQEDKKSFIFTKDNADNLVKEADAAFTAENKTTDERMEDRYQHHIRTVVDEINSLKWGNTRKGLDAKFNALVARLGIRATNPDVRSASQRRSSSVSGKKFIRRDWKAASA